LLYAGLALPFQKTLYLGSWFCRSRLNRKCSGKKPNIHVKTLY
jgi:hypothetical protein